jgi:uncharacterized protein YkwD
MECRTPRRAVLVLVAIILALIAAIPADASAATYSARRHHRHGHRRRHRHRRRVHHQTTAGAAYGSAAVPQDACANSASPARGTSLQTMRVAVVCEINLERSAHGLPGLSEAGALDNSAQGWSQTMVATQQFSHGADFSARITAAGYSWGASAENIATGYATPRSVVAAWMASLGHCRNILTPSFRDVGVGEVPAGVGVGPATWTTDFGLHLLASAPSGNWGPANGCPY